MEDLRSIRATTSMLGISEEDHFVMVDTSWENIEYEFTRLKETVIPETKVLNRNSGIGSPKLIGGIPWVDLMPAAFDLVKQNKIKVYQDGGIPRVDLLDLDQIEVSLYPLLKHSFR